MTETRATVLDARVLRVAALRRLEAAAQAHRPSDNLMDRAGKAVAALAVTMSAERTGPILMLIGPGNNGGDALVAARELHRQGIDVRVALLDDEAAFKGAALLAWTQWQERAGERATPVIAETTIDQASLIVDGLYGIGFKADAGRGLSAKARDWIARVNAARCPVLSIDIPSGVEADTGRVADVAIEADRTISFIGLKVGLLTGRGLDHRGDLATDLLGIDRDAGLERGLAFDDGDVGALNRPSLFVHAIAPRRLDSHKGSFGSVAVIGGHDGMVGAALMAARTALHAGAGRVYVKLLARHGPGFDVVQPELMIRPSLDGIDATAFAIGPGLGGDDVAMAELERGLETASPLVLDADALNAIAKHASLAAKLASRSGRGLPCAVLTPHPLEAARLLGTDVDDVQRDRVAAARLLARTTLSVVVLKGAGSIVADPSGHWVVNPTGNPALATGGTGDVLCGLVAGLLAQGIAPLDAARAATWIHGSAADDLVARGVGPIGLTASELIVAIRDIVNRLASRPR